MADSHAETGTIAAKASATPEGAGAETATTTTAEAPASGVGTADVADAPPADAPKKDEKAPKTDSKKAKTDAKEQKSVAKVADAAKKLVDTALDEVAKGEKSQNLKKVKVLRSHPAFAYHPGEVGELPVDKADELVKGGFAEVVTKSKTAE